MNLRRLLLFSPLNKTGQNKPMTNRVAGVATNYLFLIAINSFITLGSSDSILSALRA